MTFKISRKRTGLRVLLLFALLTALLSAGCASKATRGTLRLESGQTDMEYVQGKKTLVVGITDFEPMDYRDGESWTGFDAELAEKFAESLGVEMELREINWDEKISLLETGEIVCSWNGMTITDELLQSISCSKPYLSNAQVVVMQDSDMEKYSDMEKCRYLLFAVEAGSAGEKLLREMGYRHAAYDTQNEVLRSVYDGKADAAVIDMLMAAYVTGDGRDYDTLGFEIALNEETIGVGFRKDSDLTDMANEFLDSVYEDGTLGGLAEKYGIETAVLG